MIALWKKELIAFFSSLTGALVMAVFLILSGLFLWVIPGNFNILFGGYASLDGLFYMAPWLYLFLVPAITMRLFADEKKSGTLELLLTRPVSTWVIIIAKFLAGFTLVILSLIPTLIYFYSVYQLAQPVGNVDSGAIWGSYLGLLFLAGAYVAIGVFTSSLTDNQIVAFVLSALVSFLFYSGFDALASIPGLEPLETFLINLGIDAHYQSISRGVVDLRDIIFFLSIIAVFLGMTRLNFPNGKIHFFIILLVSLTINLFISNIIFRWDLTQEKRYTLADITKKFLAEQEEPIFANVFLEGDLNPGFERLSRAVKEKLDEFRVYSRKNIDYQFINPDKKSKEAQKAKEQLNNHNLSPVPVYEAKEDGTRKRTLVYPYLIFQRDSLEIAVNLLENIPGFSGAENLNASAEALEYKLTDAMRRLTMKEKRKIAFLEGHGELDELDVIDITDELSKYYQVDRGNPGGNPEMLEPYEALIIARPTQRFTETEKFAIDQYIMHGGRVLWLIDAINANLDSLRRTSQTVGLPFDLNLADQLFRYGFRINANLIQDVQSSLIPVNVSPPGQPSQFVPMPWIFNPLLNTNNQHPVTRNVAPIKTEFVSSIDTVGEDLQTNVTLLLRTSRYSRTMSSPVYISLAHVQEEPRKESFPQSFIPVAYAAEGRFPSVFMHRTAPPGTNFPANKRRNLSEPTKMVVIADGDIIKNEVRRRESQNPRIIPLGYDEATNQTFGNKQLILNAINFLTDDEGWMTLRTRNYQLRLLNREKVANESMFWKWLNLGIPLLWVFLAGIVVPITRKWLFGKKL
ncbi:gliding motility-associated ABC transporter substrate-binding protein GldG [Thermophagus xiamenensis]|uniref:ABC-2 type transport system permease protein n=1 Tax=Thermophagus xiamenensis TaxID=385682 RepID=A0A1I2AVE8_9BACT|nr:gliding motility-associated ABC transporter substrate-binding protein GldG [Thermophagus xiamenensis]SFE47954.1 ABC-2 type transport system permease protein [Thermophagus xiamenensis]